MTSFCGFVVTGAFLCYGFRYAGDCARRIGADLTGHRNGLSLAHLANIVAAISVAGVKAVPIGIDFHDGRWDLDISKLESAMTGTTKTLFINTPSNPTSGTVTRDNLRDVLALVRKHDLWIRSSWTRFTRFTTYAGTRALSFLDVVEPDDKSIFANSFSESVHNRLVAVPPAIVR